MREASRNRGRSSHQQDGVCRSFPSLWGRLMCCTIPVLATWIIRSKISSSRRKKKTIPCLQTQTNQCRIRCRHQQTHAWETIFSCDGEVFVMAGVVIPLRRLLDGCLHTLSSRLTHWTKPLVASLPLATLTDLGRSKSELIAENVLLRQQVIILKRQ